MSSTRVAPQARRIVRAATEQLQDSGSVKGRIELKALMAKHRKALSIAARQPGVGGHIDNAQGEAAQLWHTQQQVQRLFAKGAVVG